MGAREVLQALRCRRVSIARGRTLCSLGSLLTRAAFCFFCSLGGMCGAIVTAPFDVVKTRLQSDLFREKHISYGVVGASGNGAGSAVLMPRRPGGLLYNFVETGYILR